MNAIFHEVDSADAELHLGLGIVLAIFFGITLVSAVFFGLGYSFGRTGNATHGADSMPPVSSPAPLQSAMSSLRGSTATAITTVGQAPAAAKVAAPPVRVATAQRQQPQTHEPDPGRSAVTTAPAVAGTTATHAADTGSIYMVQIAAVADRKDAQALATALQKHNLNARVHSGMHDKFLHVQIGPFSTQQKAESMRHKVIAAGYKAILKPQSQGTPGSVSSAQYGVTQRLKPH